MTDPYKPPESETNSGQHQRTSKTGWKVFFWIMLTLESLSLLSMLFDPVETWIDIVAELLIYTFIFLGLFGFSYDKKIIHKYIWGYLIPIGIIYDIYTMYKIMPGDIESDFELYIIIGAILLIVLPIMIFQYLALYQYRYKSEHIWS